MVEERTRKNALEMTSFYYKMKINFMTSKQEHNAEML